DGALDAKNPFLTVTQTKAADNLTHYVGTRGEPIKKDKLFYFATYEANRYTLGAPKSIVEPTDVAGLGTTVSIPDAIAALNAKGTALSSMAVKMAGCDPTKITSGMTTGAAIAPFCGPASGAPASLFGNDTSNAGGTIPVQFNNVGGSDNGLIKLDYHVNDKNSVNGEYFIGNGNVNNAVSSISPYWLADNHIRTQTSRAVWVFTPNSTLVNEMRFGLLLYQQLGWPNDCGVAGTPDYAGTY